ncbi:MAG TPA: hypothetical protein VFV99_09565 [Kofleriaceae bacterium]|nr:hypothetical protein [Kofleriaceae bacterium]
MKRACLLLAVGCTAEPRTATDYAPLTTWAQAADFRLSQPQHCNFEEQHFGATFGTCWFAKSRHAVPAGSTMFPRMDITLAEFPSETIAIERIKHFREKPVGAGLLPEEDKAFPLRAGVRIGSRVLILATDAYAFEPDIYRAAGTLAAATHGELVCWSPPCTR